jgi:hypothetical protein
VEEDMKLSREATVSVFKGMIEAIDDHTAEQREQYLVSLSSKLHGEKLDDALDWLDLVNAGEHKEALNVLLEDVGWEREEDE